MISLLVVVDHFVVGVVVLLAAVIAAVATAGLLAAHVPVSYTHLRVPRRGYRARGALCEPYAVFHAFHCLLTYYNAVPAPKGAKRRDSESISNAGRL